MPETITLQVWPITERLPDADTDVILFDGEHPEGFVGAYLGDLQGGPEFVGTQGEAVSGVTAWCEMPRRG